MPFTRSQVEAHLRRRAREAEDLARASCADPTGREAIAALQAGVERLEERLAEALSAREGDRLRADRERESREAAEAAARRAERESDRLRRENEALMAEAESLRTEIESLVAEAESLRGEASGLRDDVLAWMRRTLEAERTVEAQRAKPDRSPENSSLPPSSDPNRGKQEKKKKKDVPNSREPSGRSRGGQRGHEGHVRRTHEPDEVVDVTPTGACPRCGGELEPFGGTKARNVTDACLVTHTVAYSGRKCRCGRCGHVERQAFPPHAPNEENWGVTVKAVVAVLCGWPDASIDKARGFLRDATHGEVDVSKGFVSNSMRQFSGRAGPLLEALEAAVRGSHVVGCDATLARTNGRTSYVYVFHCPEAAVSGPAARKGVEPLRGSPVDGNAPDQVVCHDHDTSFYSREIGIGLHAECNAHESRYLKGVCQNEPGRSWAEEMRAVLGEAHDLAEACRAEGREATYDELRGVALGYLAALDRADAEYERDGPFDDRYRPEGIALSRKLRRYFDEHLLFLLDPEVPYTNNGSERLLRDVKSKTKQSGGFRSEGGKGSYCDLLSVAKSARLHGLAPLDAALAVLGAFED